MGDMMPSNLLYVIFRLLRGRSTGLPALTGRMPGAMAGGGSRNFGRGPIGFMSGCESDGPVVRPAVSNG